MNATSALSSPTNIAALRSVSAPATAAVKKTEVANEASAPGEQSTISAAASAPVAVQTPKVVPNAVANNLAGSLAGLQGAVGAAQFQGLASSHQVTIPASLEGSDALHDSSDRKNPGYEAGFGYIVADNVQMSFDPLGGFVQSDAADVAAGKKVDGWENGSAQVSPDHIHFQGLDGSKYVYGKDSSVSGDLTVDPKTGTITEAHYESSQKAIEVGGLKIAASVQHGDISKQGDDTVYNYTWEVPSTGHRIEEKVTEKPDGTRLFDGVQRADAQSAWTPYIS